MTVKYWGVCTWAKLSVIIILNLALPIHFVVRGMWELAVIVGGFFLFVHIFCTCGACPCGGRLDKRTVYSIGGPESTEQYDQHGRRVPPDCCGTCTRAPAHGTCTWQAQKHMEARFVWVDAENAPFLTERLNIWMLPTIVIVKGNKVEEQHNGLNEIDGTGKYTSGMLEYLLYTDGVLDEAPIYEQEVREEEDELADIDCEY